MKKKNIVTRKKIGISELDINNLKKIKLGNYTRKNNFFNFSKVIVKKPWGFEFLLYQNRKLAIWILHLRKNHKTSFHCHFNKKTLLFVLKGSISFKTLEFSKKYKEGGFIEIDKKVFHQSKSISKLGSIVLELESPVNKNDLVRLYDDYGRTGIGYESRYKKIKNINKLKNDLIYKKIFISKPNKNNIKNRNFFSYLIILRGGLSLSNKKYKMGNIITNGSINKHKNIKILKNSLFLFIKKHYAIKNDKINNILKSI